MDRINIHKEYFLERKWGMNCQPGHRTGKNKRRNAKKEHKRQSEEVFIPGHRKGKNIPRNAKKQHKRQTKRQIEEGIIPDFFFTPGLEPNPPITLVNRPGYRGNMKTPPNYSCGISQISDDSMREVRWTMHLKTSAYETAFMKKFKEA